MARNKAFITNKIDVGTFVGFWDFGMFLALVKGKEKELEVAKPTEEECSGAAKIDRVDVTREHGEEVKDGEEEEEPYHSSWDPCNYVVTITKRGDDSEPYLYEVLDFRIHFFFASLSSSDRVAMTMIYTLMKFLI
nr:hypothetical protein CFP56_29303 [Quercus suber]